MKKMLILLVMMLGLVGCGSEQNVDSTPTPTIEAEMTTTTPIPTEKVEPTIAPTEAPVESEDEMKDYYIDPNTGEKVDKEPVIEAEPTTTPQVEARIYYGEVTDYEEDGTVILVHVECTHEGNFVGLCWGGGQGSIVRFRFENAEDVEKQYPIGTVVKMVSTGEPLMCPLPCWGELSGITIVTE